MKQQAEAKIKSEACDWLVELLDLDLDPKFRSPDHIAQFDCFFDWFILSERHRDAFIEAVRISNRLRDIDPHRSVDVPTLLKPSGDNIVQLVAPETFPSSARSSSKRLRGRVARFPWVLAIILTALTLIPLILLKFIEPLSSYATGIGERRFVPLDDGSSVELNTRSQIQVVFSPSVREVRLLAGEALFDVRHSDSRPFRVVTGGGVIQDVGTRFAVRRMGTREMTVSVLEGRVLLDIPDSTAVKQPQQSAIKAGSPLEIGPGHRATTAFRAHHTVLTIDDVSQSELERQLAWRGGRLTFQGETLSQAILEVNRYNRRQIVISDPVAGRRLVGGSFDATDLESFLAMLQRSFALRIVRSAPGTNAIELEPTPPVH